MPNRPMFASVLPPPLEQISSTMFFTPSCLALLNELFAFADNHKQLINELDNLYGKMKKAKESVEKEKTYKVRVLHNLFGDEINAKI